LIIGLTGNIATGKSTVARMLVDLGAEAIDADKVAHELMRAGTPVYEGIIRAFGRDILGPDGEIDRRRLASIVFADPTALARLEAFVHPATIAEVNRRTSATGGKVVVHEAIKLIESGMADACDVVWVTTCRPEQQIQRIISARGLSRSEATQRVVAQPPQDNKIARADLVIDTSQDLGRTRAQVEAGWKRLTGGTNSPYT
jgi:dephospho-CoA kinase